jgi:hypothetical protein
MKASLLFLLSILKNKCLLSLVARQRQSGIVVPFLLIIFHLCHSLFDLI